MPARINNAPSSVVVDLSYRQAVTYVIQGDAAGFETVTGTPALMIDKDLTTFYEIKTPVKGGIVALQIFIDYGQIYWNTTFSAKWNAADIGGGTFKIAHSTDNATWVNFTTTVSGETSFGCVALRYIKYEIVTNANSMDLLVYENRVMGS